MISEKFPFASPPLSKILVAPLLSAHHSYFKVKHRSNHKCWHKVRYLFWTWATPDHTAY